MKHFGFDSPAEAYGPMMGAHYDVVGRLWDGHVVRVSDLADHIVKALVGKRIVRADSENGRLFLLNPANAVRATQGAFA